MVSLTATDDGVFLGDPDLGESLVVTSGRVDLGGDEPLIASED